MQSGAPLTLSSAMAAAAQDPLPRLNDAPEPPRRRRSHRESRRRRQKRILKQVLILLVSVLVITAAFLVWRYLVAD